MAFGQVSEIIDPKALMSLVLTKSVSLNFNKPNKVDLKYLLYTVYVHINLK